MTNEEIAKALNLTVEQVEAIARKVGPKVLPTLTSKLDGPYWLVEIGMFETFITEREATTEHEALLVAYSELQPWYFTGTHHDETVVTQKTRSEYIDWLRRR